MVVTLNRSLEWCDRFYIHDGELPFHYLYDDKPTVMSLRDFVYPDTLVGGFGFLRDRLLLNSDYLARCVIDAFSRFRPSIVKRIVVVRNGIDLSHFAPRPHAPSKQLQRLLGNPSPATYTLLYPHRPDKRKGIFESLRITARLQERLRRVGHSVRLLVPTWIDSHVARSSDHEYQTIYRRISEAAEELGIGGHVHLHEWIPYEWMPEYLSMGSATLCVGNFVEAFGNVHLESVACGTPCVVASVAAHAYNLPEPLVRRIPYGDIAGAVDCAEELFRSPYETARAREFLRSHYSFKSMLDGYERVITSTQIKEPLPLDRLPPLTPDTRVRLAAWCRDDSLGIYNDYRYERVVEAKRIGLARRTSKATPLRELLHEGFAEEDIIRELKEGFLVQLPVSHVEN
jgi:glycosyltransferase involved in cell wall biosynthesis